MITQRFYCDTTDQGVTLVSVETGAVLSRFPHYMPTPTDKMIAMMTAPTRVERAASCAINFISYGYSDLHISWIGGTEEYTRYLVEASADDDPSDPRVYDKRMTAEELQEFRRELSLTDIQIAGMLSVRRDTVTAWRNGKINTRTGRPEQIPLSVRHELAEAARDLARKAAAMADRLESRGGLS